MANNDLTKADIRKQNFKMAVGIYLRTILAAVLCLFVYMSITMLITGFTTQEIGYVVYESTSDGSVVEVERHYYADDSSAPSSAPPVQQGPGLPGAAQGEEAEPADTTTETTLAPGQQRQSIRSDPPAGALVAQDIISSVLMLMLLAAFPYSIVWPRGDRDKNAVNFGHMQEDKLRGLKVGLMAAIPSFVGYILLVLSKLGVFWSGYFLLYRFLNVPFMPLLDALAPAGVQATAQVPWSGIAVMLVAVLFVPLVCHVAYTLGYHQISVMEKLVYKNTSKKKKRRW